MIYNNEKIKTRNCNTNAFQALFNNLKLKQDFLKFSLLYKIYLKNKIA